MIHSDELRLLTRVRRVCVPVHVCVYRHMSVCTVTCVCVACVCVHDL